MVNTEQACAREYTLETLKKPDFVSDDSSNISFLHLHSDKVLVGHEEGCYLMNIESNSGPAQLTEVNECEVVSLCSHPEDTNLFFVATDKYVHFYDERVSLTAHQHKFVENADEVNRIQTNKQGHLAACDDAGEIKIYDLKTNSVFRSLRRKHTNICSCLTFLPESRSDELITGGLDSQLFVWDYKRVKVLQSINSQELLSELGDDSVYMFNPPLVYGVDIAADGKTFAAGLGNGTLQLFKVLKGKRILAPYAVLNRHSSVGVSEVSFVKPQATDSSSYLVTGGNDGIVNLWCVPVDAPSKKAKKLPPISNKVYEEEEMDGMLVASMDTHSKVNFIANAHISDQRFAFVCDQTSSLKYFKI